MSRGAQNKGKTYLKIPCMYCHVPIATNGLAAHYRNCKARAEFLSKDRAERLRTMPLDHMTLSECEEAGRMDELRKLIHKIPMA